jgi:aminocarboxymuconate-semialdehyde decarboxylase
MLRNLIDKYGSQQVLLGTDYPFDMGEDDPVGLINSVPRLKPAEREMIMGRTAARLLKIKG